MKRRRVLMLFGGRSAEHDVSRATAVAVASALDYRARPRIVLTSLDFPSCQYVWREQARAGAFGEMAAWAAGQAQGPG